MIRRNCSQSRSRPPDTNPRVRFYHIAKVGGTTVKSILTQYHAQKLHGQRKPPFQTLVAACAPRRCQLVTWVRSPLAKVLSSFLYQRSTDRKAQCQTLRQRLRGADSIFHNHMYNDLIAGAPLGECSEHPRRLFERSTPGMQPADVCPAGAAVFARRVAELLSVPGVFVGVTDRFDESVLAMQRYYGFSSVNYCRRRSMHGGARPDGLPAALRAEILRHNALDAVVFEQAQALLTRHAACLNVTATAVRSFQVQLASWQRARHDNGISNASGGGGGEGLCANGNSDLDARVDTSTVGNVSWRAPWCRRPAAGAAGSKTRMLNCPRGWPLEANKRLQVCRKADGSGNWMCGRGWTKLSRAPYCVVK